MNYKKTMLDKGKWVITDVDHDYMRPTKAVTFAFDTETQVYLNSKKLSQADMLKKTKKMTTAEKRKRLSNTTWSWQAYDELNGFFMTNSFEEWLFYQCRAGYKFGWCYNSAFDFSQIDYEILANAKDKWKPHSKETNTKGQPWTYESIHNDMGSRYAYKLWIPYKNADRHVYTHSVEYRDFMKLVAGGLARLLKDLDIRRPDGSPIRKSSMEYQAVDTDNLTDDEIDYCRIDVEGLYFAIKKFDRTIAEQSGGECSIFGERTNLMTAGGFAKRELLRSMYPHRNRPTDRVKQFQKEHPLTATEDKFIRDNHLYRGGISYVNPRYRGKMLTKDAMASPMYRYDVNSEYPYSMASIRDLVGRPRRIKLEEWEAMSEADKDGYECIYMLNSVVGSVNKGYLGFWYDPFKRDFVDFIDESGLHLMFERELIELSYWYDLEYTCEEVIIIKRGGYAFRPFVERNYKTKADAKKDGNATLQRVAKLLLNSSYGKLAERLERVIGHYELNEETDAIHFVVDGTETDAKSSLNVIIGALVTSVARCYILSKIREICGDEIDKRFVYIDTDSIHAFADYPKADPYTLGGLKLEAVCGAVKYIAPKTYIDIEQVNKDGTIDYDKFEIHSKGVNVQAVVNDLKKKQKGKKKGKPTLALIDRKIDYGSKYVCLVSMNVKGGKILLPTEKYLARYELAPDDDSKLVYANMEGGILTEI